METMLFLVNAALVAGLAAWMTVAVADNGRQPRMNEEALATVVRPDLMASEYPEEYALIAHRRIDDPTVIRRLFHAIRRTETLAAAALVLSALLLLGAAGGAVPGAVAMGAGVPSTAFFTSIWCGFVIGGNYLAYWYCHQWAQPNHFMLMFWGFFVLIVLLL